MISQWRPRHTNAVRATTAIFAGLLGRERVLVLFFVNEDRLQVFRFVHLTAIQASHVVDTISACEHFSFVVIARTFHKRRTSPF